MISQGRTIIQRGSLYQRDPKSTALLFGAGWSDELGKTRY